MRTASGPPDARARRPASIQLLRGVLVTVGIVYPYLIHPALTTPMLIHTVQYCIDQVSESLSVRRLGLGGLMGSAHQRLREQSALGQSRERVRQVDVPPTARALSTLPDVDYADAFLVE